jgi:transposase-like protein
LELRIPWSEAREQELVARSEEAASKLIYLALRNIVIEWKRPPTHWGAAAHQFALKFGERFISPPLATEKQ